MRQIGMQGGRAAHHRDAAVPVHGRHGRPSREAVVGNGHHEGPPQRPSPLGCSAPLQVPLQAGRSTRVLDSA